MCVCSKRYCPITHANPHETILQDSSLVQKKKTVHRKHCFPHYLELELLALKKRINGYSPVRLDRKIRHVQHQDNPLEEISNSYIDRCPIFIYLEFFVMALW